MSSKVFQNVRLFFGTKKMLSRFPAVADHVIHDDDKSVDQNSESGEDASERIGSGSSDAHEHNQERDEEKEIRKYAANENTQVVIWRSLVAFALIATAVSVSVASFLILGKEEETTFERAVGSIPFLRFQDCLLYDL